MKWFLFFLMGALCSFGATYCAKVIANVELTKEIYEGLFAQSLSNGIIFMFGAMANSTGTKKEVF